jgi:hypothetical protein
MAKPSWLTITPMQGSGNQTVRNIATPHTGRVVREGIVTITAAGVATPVTYKVAQEALPEYVEWSNGTEMAVSLEGGTVVIAGTSNSSKLTFDWGKAFSDGKIEFTVTVTDLATGVKYEKTISWEGGTKENQKVLNPVEFVLEAPIEGDFTIEFVNNSPSASTSNKDRVTIANIVWYN